MKLFVWDLHGVLEEGNEKAVEWCTNLVLEREGIDERISLDEVKTLYGRKWFEFFQYLGLPREECFRLQERAFELSGEYVKEWGKLVTPTRYAHEVLAGIHLNGQDQILISQTNSNGLKNFLDILELDGFFPSEKAFAADAHQTIKTKRDILEGYLKGKEYEKVISIGDSPGDIELAGYVHNGVSILYAHPGRVFRRSNWCKAREIRDLRDVLKEL